MPYGTKMLATTAERQALQNAVAATHRNNPFFLDTLAWAYFRTGDASKAADTERDALRLLPAGWRVVGLNVFSAVCAALTLAILARSVRLLPHDRTKEQRIREGGEFALLSVRAAFLPVALAVLLLAGQLTFWENAVVGTGEMLDLLVFAFLILCLLEFRISQNETWLSVFALVYGMGVTNNWALIGFFPCFLAALVWIKRLGFFNIRFAARMTGLGALGLLLYGLIPLLGAAAHDAGFWALLHQKLAEQYLYLTGIRRFYPAIAMVPTLIPLLFAGINWPVNI